MALCFEITINDGPPMWAGLDDISVLTAALTYVGSRNEIELRAGGLLSKGAHDNEHLEWIQQELKRGDRVSIRVAERAEPSVPLRRERQDPYLSEREERAYYEQLKARYEST